MFTWLTRLPMLGRLFTWARRLLPGKGALLIVIAVAIVAAFGAWFWHQAQVSQLHSEISVQQARIEQLDRNRQQWMESAGEHRIALERTRADREAAQTAVETLQAKLDTQAGQYERLQQRIRRAPASEDGPVAPVLRDALEALP